MTILFLALMLSGTFALGISDVLRRKHLKDGLNDQALLVITLFLTGILLLPILVLVGIPEIEDGFWSAVAITGFLNLISQNLFVRAFKLSDASLIAPLRLIIPPLVIFTGFLFLNEKPSLAGVVGIFITMSGLWFLLGGGKIFRYQNRQSSIKDRGVAYGLIGSVLFAASFPFDKIAVVRSSALFATFFIFTSLGILTYVINMMYDRKFTTTVIESFTQHCKAHMLISLFSSVGVVLTNQALHYSLVAYASSLKRLQALWTVVIAGKFLEEREMGRRAIATLLMFIGILPSVFLN
ncbi:MAG: EamA family transporter [bacterium]|nr:EamA family transporter [bacterium]MDZ4285090.1 EamA family transporter [Patescibacteria group bacterium]